MRARAEPEPTVIVVRRRLPRPVVWLLWLLGALVGSVVVGFLAGLARPRDPDPWRPGPPPGPASSEGESEPQPETTSDPRPHRPEET